MIRLFGEDPELLRVAPRWLTPRLRQLQLARVELVKRGPWTPALAQRDLLYLIVLAGFLARSVSLAHGRAMELLGPGDVLSPAPAEHESIYVSARWQALTPAEVAVIGRDLEPVLAHVPGLGAELVARATRRSERLLLQGAISGTHPLERRLHLLLWHLACRWGERRDGGVVIGVPLTHECLAELCHAERSWVTRALGRLRGRHLLRPAPGKRWVLLGPPPGKPASIAPELRAAGSRTLVDRQPGLEVRSRPRP